MRRTKILCTLGPASTKPEVLTKMIQAGMDGARINFSHGSYSEHAKTLQILREISGEMEVYIPVIADLQGPKIRVGFLNKGRIELIPGTTVTLLSGTDEADPPLIPVSYPSLAKDVRPGDNILLDDGKIRLTVKDIRDNFIDCTVVVGGILTNHKGINLPGVRISEPSLTTKDLADLQFIIENDFDYVALSFVRRAEDLEDLRRFLHKNRSDIPIICKIEKPEALNNLDDILKEADAMMVARGDLGVEIGAENVPGIQKEVIEKANRLGLTTITATQMLESMINAPTPTRAEASDVANAVFDGSDVVMLSGETSVGNYPVEAVKIMAKIVESAEAKSEYVRPVSGERSSLFPSSDAIAHAAVLAANDLNARAILSFSQSGSTCRLIAKYRPVSMIYGASSDGRILRRMGLYWGVQAIKLFRIQGTDSMIEHIESELLQRNYVKNNDMVVITAGTPISRPGTTNTLKIQRILAESAVRSIRECTTNQIKLQVDEHLCIQCGICVEICPVNIYELRDSILFVNAETLNKCFRDKLCVTVCPTDSISLEFSVD